MHPFFALRDHLPELAFDPHRDQATIGYPPVQDYLKFYKLDLPAFICRKHFMGRFMAAGYELVAQYWLPVSGQPKGSVFFLHGYYDHAGLFSHLIRFLLQQDLVVVLYDQPGHGLSSGEPASINDFAEYAEVLQRCLQLAGKLPKPWYGIAQSTGCAVYLLMLMQEKTLNPFERIVLLAPLIRPAHWCKGLWLYRLLSPFARKIARHFNRNSHDDAFVAFVHEDPLQSHYLKTAWAGAMKKWLETFPSLESISARILVIQGEKDETVDWRHNLRLLQQKLQGAEYCRLPEAAHHLANEREDLRQQVFAQIRHFLLEPF